MLLPGRSRKKIRTSQPRRISLLRREHQGQDADEWMFHSRSVVETERLGGLIGRLVKGGEVIALYGELGTGKTALVRGIAAGLGAHSRAVSSPTFVLIHEYQGRIKLAHADLYRLEGSTELYQLGLQDYFDGHTVVAIEWADRANVELPPDRLEIHLTHQNRRSRTIRMSATGVRAHQFLSHLMTAHARSLKS